MSNADDFLDSPTVEDRPKAGQRCLTCTHPRRKEIDDDLYRYVERRLLPEDDPEYVSRELVPWAVYVRSYLLPTYPGLPRTAFYSMRYHAKHHLDLDIPV